MSKKDDLEDIRKEFERLKKTVKSYPNTTEELIKQFEENQKRHLISLEETIKEDKEYIEKANTLLAKQSKIISETELVDDCVTEHRAFLTEYQALLKSGKIKTCHFQEDVVGPILKTSAQFSHRIFNFSHVCYEQFLKNNYAGLILVRANIENLMLFYYYIRKIDEHISKKEWLKVAKLNLRIMYVKKARAQTPFDQIFNMDFMDYVTAMNATVSEAKEDQTINMSDVTRLFFDDMENKYQFNFDDLFPSSLLKKIELIELYKQTFYNESNYSMLCEIVHPVAISRKPYPYDLDSNSARHIFAHAHRHMPFCTSLFFYGIKLYERLKKIEYNEIEKKLRDSITEIIEKYRAKHIKIAESDSKTTAEMKEFIDSNYKKKN